jgi:hypothetical protein
VNLRQVAQVALQLVNSKIALQTLQPVLADLAAKQNLKRELECECAAQTERLERLKGAVATADAERVNASARAAAAYQEAVEHQKQRLRDLGIRNADAEASLAKTNEELARAEKQLADVRAAIGRANSAIG